jgi:hypothetical protein
MTPVRLLVTGRTENQVLRSLERARAVLDDGLGHGGSEIVIVTRAAPRRHSVLDRVSDADDRVRLLVGHGWGAAHMLDVGLFLRPMPTMVGIVGTESDWSRDLTLVAPRLLTAGVGAAVRYEAIGGGIEPLLRHGGLFAPGPLCAAGGFVGDGVRSIAERLESIGFATLELASAGSVPTSSGHPMEHSAGA